MAKQPLTVELDEDVILAALAEASRTGQSMDAVVEQALRERLAQGSITDERSGSATGTPPRRRGGSDVDV
jgi:hypothetical protein